jgi:hypothetical protein
MRALPMMSITRQFSLLATLGVVLTLAGLALTLKRSYDLAFEAKRNEVQHLSQAASGACLSVARDGAKPAFGESPRRAIAG